MDKRKIIPLTDREDTRLKLVRAVGPTLAGYGFENFSLERVAEQAGVRPGLVRRHFGTMHDLVSEYAATSDFWPTVEELLGDPAELKKLTPPQQMGLFFRKYLDAIRERPDTQRIMAWEVRERTHLTRILEHVRERTWLELFEYIKGDFPGDVDLSAVVMLLAGAFHFVAIRAGSGRTFGGIDFHSDMSWQRMGDTLYELVTRTLAPDAADCPDENSATP